MRNSFNCKAATTLIAVGLVLLAPQAGRAQFNNLPYENYERQVAIRQAGLRGDRSQIPAMINMLQNPPDSYSEGVADRMRLPLLHALAQLGATDALPVIDDLINKNNGVAVYARVAKARLVAESSVKSLPGKAQSTGKITRFLQELSLTAADINTAAAAYNVQKDQWRASIHPSDHPGPAAPKEVIALREVADMIYHDTAPGAMALPLVKQINFDLDSAAALKTKLAPMSREQRISVLIDDLAKQKYGPLALEQQLLADEGLPARRAVYARLKEIVAHPAEYTEPRTQRLNEGYRSLYDVYTSIGKEEPVAQSPVPNNTAKPNGIRADADVVHNRVHQKMRRQFVVEDPGF